MAVNNIRLINNEVIKCNKRNKANKKEKILAKFEKITILLKTKILQK